MDRPRQTARRTSRWSPRTSRTVLAVGLVAAATRLLAAEDPKGGNTESLASLQLQINELKTGQQSLLKELDEIKRLLQERPTRADYPAKPAVPSVIPLNVHGEPFRGEAAARVAIVEYSSFDCSFCAKFSREIYPRLEQEYIQPGKIKFFFRDLPAPTETNALLKARAARCAGEQGKFWEMHDCLFALQPPAEDLARQAQGLGLDVSKFNLCLASDRFTENIERSTAGARRMGVLGTPTFLIGRVSDDGEFVWASKVLVGVEPYDVFRTNLEERLLPPTRLAGAGQN